MNISSTHSPTIPLNTILLESGQKFNIEPGAMHACKNVDMETRLNGSIWNAVKHYFLGGESVFINTYKTLNRGAWVALEEEHRGQVAGYQLTPGETFFLQKATYMASDAHVKIEARWGGLSYFFRGLGLWKTVASLPDGLPPGRIFFGAKNGIVKAIKVDGTVTVDNDSIIGYTDKLKMVIKKLGNVKTTLLSGEGFVNEVTGKGTVFVGTKITKAEKSNYIEQIVSKSIDSITNGKVNTFTIAVFSALFIMLTSRVFNEGKPQYSKEIFIKSFNLFKNIFDE